MRIKIERFLGSNEIPVSSRTTEQSEPNWNELKRRAKKYGWEVKIDKKDGKVVRYEEKYKTAVLGSDRYVITVEKR